MYLDSDKCVLDQECWLGFSRVLAIIDDSQVSELYVFADLEFVGDGEKSQN